MCSTRGGATAAAPSLSDEWEGAAPERRTGHRPGAASGIQSGSHALQTIRLVVGIHKVGVSANDCVVGSDALARYADGSLSNAGEVRRGAPSQLDPNGVTSPPLGPWMRRPNPAAVRTNTVRTWLKWVFPSVAQPARPTGCCEPVSKPIPSGRGGRSPVSPPPGHQPCVVRVAEGAARLREERLGTYGRNVAPCHPRDDGQASDHASKAPTETTDRCHGRAGRYGCD